MGPARLLAFLACAAVVATHARPEQEPRLALVIGNGAYRDAPLANPVNDARDVAKLLADQGFRVILRENATLREMHIAAREFGDGLTRDSVALFYFAGHGMQVRGRNYLIPVGADIAREDEVSFSAFDVVAVMDKFESARSRVNLVVLDACRNNPFAGRFKVSQAGLAQIDAPPGTLIAFATAPGSVADDGTGRNGLYTHHVLANLSRPDTRIEDVFKAVRAGVRIASSGRQVPWESTSLETEFMMRATRPAVAMAGARPTAAPATIASPPAFAPGDSWTYRVTSKTGRGSREQRIVIREIRGEEVEYEGGSSGDQMGNHKRVAEGGQVREYTPSSLFYLFPLSPGASWSVKFTESNLREVLSDVDATISVQGEETLETPVGIFRAIRIRRDGTWKSRKDGSSGTLAWTYWYNSAVKRWLRAESRVALSSGRVLVEERFDLVSYEVR